jgi:hypothetical protein
MEIVNVFEGKLISFKLESKILNSTEPSTGAFGGTGKFKCSFPNFQGLGNEDVVAKVL